MEREELLHGKTKMRGLRSQDSESEEEIEIFNRRRPGNQGRSCEVCGVILVVLCLTFFASTVIFGARYMTTMRQLEIIEAEKTRLTLVINDVQLSDDVIELRKQVNTLQQELQSCKSQVETLSDSQNTEATSTPNESEGKSQPEEPKNMKNPSGKSDLHETPRNYGSRSYFERFGGVFFSLLLVAINVLLIG